MSEDFKQNQFQMIEYDTLMESLEELASDKYKNKVKVLHQLAEDQRLGKTSIEQNNAHTYDFDDSEYNTSLNKRLNTYQLNCLVDQEQDPRCSLFTLDFFDKYADFIKSRLYNSEQVPFIEFSNMLRIFSQCLKFFVPLHIYQRFKFLPYIESRCLNTIDPITRQQIRKRNIYELKNEQQENKENKNDLNFSYFTFCYNLTQIIEECPPKKVNEKHNFIGTILNIIKTCFEFGLINNTQGETIIEKLSESLKVIIDYDSKICKRIDQALEKKVADDQQNVTKDIIQKSKDEAQKIKEKLQQELDQVQKDNKAQIKEQEDKRNRENQELEKIKKKVQEDKEKQQKAEDEYQQHVIELCYIPNQMEEDFDANIHLAVQLDEVKIEEDPDEQRKIKEMEEKLKRETLKQEQIQKQLEFRKQRLAQAIDVHEEYNEEENDDQDEEEDENEEKIDINQTDKYIQQIIKQKTDLSCVLMQFMILQNDFYFIENFDSTLLKFDHDQFFENCYLSQNQINQIVSIFMNYIIKDIKFDDVPIFDIQTKESDSQFLNDQIYKIIQSLISNKQDSWTESVLQINQHIINFRRNYKVDLDIIQQVKQLKDKLQKFKFDQGLDETETKDYQKKIQEIKQHLSENPGIRKFQYYQEGVLPVLFLINTFFQEIKIFEVSPLDNQEQLHQIFCAIQTDILEIFKVIYDKNQPAVLNLSSPHIIFSINLQILNERQSEEVKNTVIRLQLTRQIQTLIKENLKLFHQDDILQNLAYLITCQCHSLVSAVKYQLKTFEKFSEVYSNEELNMLILLFEKLMEFIKMSNLLVDTKLVPHAIRYPFDLYFQYLFTDKEFYDIIDSCTKVYSMSLKEEQKVKYQIKKENDDQKEEEELYKDDDPRSVKIQEPFINLKEYKEFQEQYNKVDLSYLLKKDFSELLIGEQQGLEQTEKQKVIDQNLKEFFILKVQEFKLQMLIVLSKSIQSQIINKLYNDNITNIQEIKLQNYNYLLKSKNGIRIKKELITIYYSFMIAPEDKLTQVEQYQLQYKDSEFKERGLQKMKNPFMFFDEQYLEQIEISIMNELKMLSLIPEQFTSETEKDESIYYLMKGYAPALYQYCKIIGSMIETMALVNPGKESSSQAKAVVDLKYIKEKFLFIKQLFEEFQKQEKVILNIIFKAQHDKSVLKAISAWLAKNEELPNENPKQQQQQERLLTQEAKLSPDELEEQKMEKLSDPSKRVLYAMNIRKMCYDILNVLDYFDNLICQPKDSHLYDIYFREDVKTKQKEQNLKQYEEDKKLMKLETESSKQHDQISLLYSNMQVFIAGFIKIKQEIMEKDQSKNKFIKLLLQAKNKALAENLTHFLMYQMSCSFKTPYKLQHMELGPEAEENTYFFWFEPQIYQQLKTFNSLLSSIKIMRQIVYNHLSSSEDKLYEKLNKVNKEYDKLVKVQNEVIKTKIFKIVEDNQDKEQETGLVELQKRCIEQIKEQREKYLTKKKDIKWEFHYKSFIYQIFKIIRDVYYSVTYRAFHGDLWVYKYGVFIQSTDVFKNCAERNFQSFKTFIFNQYFFKDRKAFFDHFNQIDQIQDSIEVVVPNKQELINYDGPLQEKKPQPQIDALELDQFIPQQIYKMTCILLFEHSSLMKPNQKDTLQPNDRVENIEIITRMLQLITEFINGPNEIGILRIKDTKQGKFFLRPFNHELQAQQESYTTPIQLINKMSSILFTKKIYDINSNFYVLINQIVAFLSSFTEIQDQNRAKTIQDISRDAKPHSMIILIHHLISSLYRKIKYSSNSKMQAQKKEDQVAHSKRDQMVMNSVGEQASSALKLDLSRLERGDQVQILKENIVRDDPLPYQRITDPQQLVDIYQKEEKFETDLALEIAFNLYFLFQSFAEYNPLFENVNLDIKKQITNLSNETDWKKREIACVQQFLRLQTQKIEVKNEKNNSQYLTFIKVPEAKYLTESKKEEYRERCSIADSKSKMNDLIQLREELSQEANFYDNMYKLSSILYYLSTDNTYQAIKLSSFSIGIALCLIQLIFVAHISTETTKYGGIIFQNDGQGENMENLYNILNYVLIGFSGVFLVIFLFTRYIINIRLAVIREASAKWYIKPFMVFFISPLLLQSTFSASMLFHILFAVLSLTVNQLFTSLHLLLIVNVSKTAMNVLKSIFRNFSQLISTYILILIIIWFYTLIVSQYFHDQFSEDASEGIKDKYGAEPDLCKTLRGCFGYVITFGLRQGGGVADVMKLYKSRQSKFFPKLLFDLTFYLFVNLICLNITFGIIIDAFKSQKEERAKLDKDKQELCFVCGNKRLFIEKKMTFTEHIELHDPWKYINFLFYLEKKIQNEYNGLENHIADNLSTRNLQWVPIGDTILLPEDQDDPYDGIFEQLMVLKKNVTDIKDFKFPSKKQAEKK